MRPRGDVHNLWWAAGAAAILAVAHVLPPDSVGYGPHRLLRVLPPCFFRELTGLPCPGCGLTTSVCETARGQVRAALSHHYLGPVFYFGAWALLLWAIAAVALGIKGPRSHLGRSRPWVVFFAVYLGAWAARLVAQRPG